MEGSVAAAGAAGADAGQQQGAEGADAGGVDLNALAGQMEGFQQGQEQLRSLVTDLAAQLAPAQTGTDDAAATGDEGSELDLSFLDDPSLDSAEVAANLQGLIDNRAQQIAQAATGPLAERLSGFERRAELQALVDEVPEMADEAIQRQVVSATAQMADAYGWPEHLKTDPKMYRIVYMAARAAELHNAEGDGSDNAVATLEGGGGARAAAVQQANDLGDSIVGARKGRGALPFG